MYRVHSGGDKVADIRKIELTEDPLTNIKMMIPMLNERSREAVSYLMFGCCLGESLARAGSNREDAQET